MRKPSDLSRDEIERIVRRITEILWPEGDPGAEWDAETIDEVALVLEGAELRPEEETNE
jgi:hypothetical protein